MARGDAAPRRAPAMSRSRAVRWIASVVGMVVMASVVGCSSSRNEVSHSGMGSGDRVGSYVFSPKVRMEARANRESARNEAVVKVEE